MGRSAVPAGRLIGQLAESPLNNEMNTMWRCLLRWIAPLLVAGACFLPPAHAQNQAQTTTTTADEKPPPAPQYFVAVVCTILILVMLCYPSRKS